MLASAHDEALFEYYGTSQLAFVDAASGQRTPIGRPAIYTDFSPSPDGNFMLVAARQAAVLVGRAVPALPDDREVVDRQRRAR